MERAAESRRKNPLTSLVSTFTAVSRARIAANKASRRSCSFFLLLAPLNIFDPHEALRYLWILLSRESRQS